HHSHLEVAVVPKYGYHFALIAINAPVTAKMVSNVLLRDNALSQKTSSLETTLSYLKTNKPAFKICFIDAEFESVRDPTAVLERIRKLSFPT
ncbi:MAG: hypothetical protein NXI00_23595, partial [Cytophagales bacterium]|nr:hypothetical protein [Cytophagales bacterium]